MEIKDNTITVKFCPLCETQKPISEFSKDNSKKNGRKLCKACVRQKMIDKACSVTVSEKRCIKCKEVKPISEFMVNKSTITGHGAWCFSCGIWVSMKNKYGVGREWYESIFSIQKGLCAICHQPSSDRLCADHDHSTGKMRGLLCQKCNAAIGHFKDSQSIIRSAIDYLNKHNLPPVAAKPAEASA